MKSMGSFVSPEKVERRVRAANYLTVAQLFLQDNFLLKRSLKFEDIKPRLLGHWGTCPGINLAYACLHDFYKHEKNYSFILGPGHGFPALQANLFIDGDLGRVDFKARRNAEGIAYISRQFSWPGGFPSHASPLTPGVICEGGELGYALAAAYGYSLGHPEKLTAVLIGDGEFETATALASMNLNKILAGPYNGKVLPILHLNGYKISGPTISGRKSKREMAELVRGFGFRPIFVENEDETSSEADEIMALAESFGRAFDEVEDCFANAKHPFIIMRTPKGLSGPKFVGSKKIEGTHGAHQIPLLNAKTDLSELEELERWMKSYHFEDLFDERKGFVI